MRDINKAIEFIEEKTWGSHDQRPSQPADKPEPSPRAWRAPDAVLRPASAEEREAHKQFGRADNTVVARSVKLTIPLEPATVAALAAPESGPPRIRLVVTFKDGALRAEIAAKSLRKAQRILAENSPDAVFCQLIGKLAAKNEIIEAGLVAQVKTASAGKE